MNKAFPKIPRFAGSVLLAGIVSRIFMAATLGLSDDEAWYWSLAQKIDYSYVVHPPLSIWMVWLSTHVFSNHVLFVRLPAIFCMGLGTFWLLRLACKMGYEDGAFMVPLLTLMSPLLFVGGILVGPDLPLFLFWSGLMGTSYELGTSDRNVIARWIVFGILAGFAFLSKYTAFLTVPIALVWIFSTSQGRRNLRGRWPWISLAIALTIFSPTIFWNLTHHWSSFRFQFIERHNAEQAQWKRWGIFWISQFFLMGPALFFAWFQLLKTQKDENLRFLALWAFFPGLIFFIQPLYSPFKIHWALFAFIPVLVYFAKVIRTSYSRFTLFFGMASSFVMTIVGVASLYSPLMPRLTTFFTKKVLNPENDVSNDFYGWNSFATEWHRLPEDLKELPLITSRYQIAAQAAFALKQKNLVHILPLNQPDVIDWGGSLDQYPSNFLYINDNRYKENTKKTFLNHNCQLLSSVNVLRSSFFAKSFEIHTCQAKVISLNYYDKRRKFTE